MTEPYYRPSRRQDAYLHPTQKAVPGMAKRLAQDCLDLEMPA